MRWLRALASSESSDSLAVRFRRKRFQLFLRILNQCGTSSATILDVGGTERFWEVMNFADGPERIVILNLTEFQPRHQGITSVAGDARDLSRYQSGEFDIVFSNSVIEHLPTIDDQIRMAEEIRRVGRFYFVQTPNFFFPIEPHFLTPGIHWLPQELRAALVRTFPLGHYDRLPADKAREVVEGIRLLKKSELRLLFPDGRIVSERWLGLTKSLIAVRAS